MTLAQLRLGECSLLQSYLYNIRKADTPACPHCDAPVEDAEHYLLRCAAWAPMRLHLLGPDPQPAILQQEQVKVLTYLGGHANQSAGEIEEEEEADNTPRSASRCHMINPFPYLLILQRFFQRFFRVFFKKPKIAFFSTK